MAIFPTAAMGADGPDGLNHRQRRFAEEYLRDRRPKAAAVRAGYGARHAAHSAWRLLHHRGVRAFIDKADRARADRLSLSVDRILLEHARVAFADMGTLVRLTRKGLRLRPGAADGMAAVSEIRRFKGGFQLRLFDKPRALDTVSRLLGIAERVRQSAYDPAERIRLGAEVREKLLAQVAKYNASRDSGAPLPPAPAAATPIEQLPGVRQRE